MSIATVPSHVLAKVEQSLALMRPFGDGDYIYDCIRTRYQQHLGMLTRDLPEARTLLAALHDADPVGCYRVIGDPVFRSAIHILLGHFKLHLPQHNVAECVALLRDATYHLITRTGASPLAVGAPGALRLGNLSHHGWVWSVERKEDVWGKTFGELMHNRMDYLEPVTPDDRVARNLKLGAELLAELLPQLSRSALTHVHLVVVADVSRKQPLPPGESAVFTSNTNPHIPGTIFLAPGVLQDPWSVAEYLLHEALHQKFVDLEHTHSMLRKGYSIDESPIIHPPWHRIRLSGPPTWHVNRSISVTHVYTALALFFTRVNMRAAELEGRYGPVKENVPLSIRQSFDRATYLGEKLLGAKDELGMAGQRFLHWLNELLSTFDPQPPPSGSYVHLLLDLYDREAEDVAIRISRATPADLERLVATTVTAPEEVPMKELVRHLEQEESTRARDILTALGENVPPRFDGLAATQSPRAESPADLATRFRETRTRISEALRKVPWASYQEVRPGASGPSDELVRDMLSYSDHHLGRIMKHLNPDAQA